MQLFTRLPLLIVLSLLSLAELQAQCGNVRVDASYELGGNDICEGEPITVRNITEEQGNENTIYIWDWGDGTRDTINDRIDVPHTYNFEDINACTVAGGFQTVELRLDAIVPGCPQLNHFVIKPVFVFLKPEADFEPSTNILCAPEFTTSFLNTSCTADTAATYRWNFDDPASGASNTSTEVNPSHTFSAPGIYNVQLTVNSNCGSSVTLRQVEVKELPIAQADIELLTNSPCSPVSITFDNQSQGANEFKWDIIPPISGRVEFIDTTNNSFTEPRLQLTGIGIYTILLEARNECGTTPLELEYEVFERPVVQLTKVETACEQLTYLPEVNYLGTIESYNWTISGDTSLSFSDSIPEPIVLPPGSYQSRIEVASVCGTDFAEDTTILVLDRPEVAIQAVAPVCNSGDTIRLQATPSDALGRWDGPGVTTDGIFDPKSADLTIGTNTLTYTYGVEGCLAEEMLEIEVKQAAAIDAGRDQEVCIDETPFIQEDFSPIGGRWEGDGIDSAGLFSPVFVGAGVHQVTYVFFDTENQCTAQSSKNILVQALPEVSVVEDTISLCANDQDIELRESLTIDVFPDGGTEAWTGAGIVSASRGVFNSSTIGAGTFDVIYTYRTNPLLCASSDTFTLVLQSVEPVSVQADTSICINNENLFLTATPANGSWESLTNDSPPIDQETGLVSLTRGGTFTYRYFTFPNSTCASSDELTLTIIDPGAEVEAGEDLSVCEGTETVSFSGFPMDGFWDGEGIDTVSGMVDVSSLSPDTYEYIYEIESNAIAGCTAQDRVALTIHPLPDNDFEVNGSLCKGEEIIFQNLTTGASTYAWNFESLGESIDENPVFRPEIAGVYNVQLIAFTNTTPQCQSTIERQIRISEPPPEVVFDIDQRTGCADLEVNFTNRTVGEDLELLWNFGNGDTSALFDPNSIIYSRGLIDTTYVISLIAANSCGTEVFEDSILVKTEPTARFGTNFDAYCSGDTVRIFNASIGTVDTYRWDYGNGRSSTDSLAINQLYFTEEGNSEYTIQLIVENECGTDTTSRTLQITPTDVSAPFNIDSMAFCLGDTIRLESLATVGATLLWDFGDGNRTNLQNPNYVFSDVGSYTISHYAFGCGFDSTIVSVSIKPTPNPEFAIDGSRCALDTLQFENLTTNIVATSWDFGDGNTSDFSRAQHIYDSTGTYEVLLKVTANNQCSASTARTISIQELPSFNLAIPDSVCVNSLAEFEVIADQLYDSYNWQFGDLELGSGRFVTHAYTATGSYEVIAEVKDGFGCSATDEGIVFVRPTPVADFEFEILDNCLPATVVFTNFSQLANSFNWNFSDNTTATSIDVTKTFTDSDTILATLTATFDGICSDVFQQVIPLNSIPTIDFQAFDISCFGENDGQIQIQDNRDYEITLSGENYFQPGVDLFPNLLPGIYELEVIAPTGCDTIYQITIREPDPLLVNIQQDTLKLNQGEIGVLDVSVNAQNVQYTWFPDTAITSIGNNQFEVLARTSQAYSLTVEDENGCQASDATFVLVNREAVIYIPNIFNPQSVVGNETIFPQAGAGVTEILTFQIFNRWGNMVFEANNFSPNSRLNGWNGTFNGKLHNPAVFVYKLEVLFEDGSTEWITGDFTLIH